MQKHILISVRMLIRYLINWLVEEGILQLHTLGSRERRRSRARVRAVEPWAPANLCTPTLTTHAGRRGWRAPPLPNSLHEAAPVRTPSSSPQSYIVLLLLLLTQQLLRLARQSRSVGRSLRGDARKRLDVFRRRPAWRCTWSDLVAPRSFWCCQPALNRQPAPFRALGPARTAI